MVRWVPVAVNRNSRDPREVAFGKAPNATLSPLLLGHLFWDFINRINIVAYPMMLSPRHGCYVHAREAYLRYKEMHSFPQPSCHSRRVKILFSYSTRYKIEAGASDQQYIEYSRFIYAIRLRYSLTGSCPYALPGVA